LSSPYQGTSLAAYAGLHAFAGDIHNHCGISYGHGTIEDAYRNARLQLDFASVTGHASWHDMPDRPAHVRHYHEAGFARLRRGWEHVQDVTEAVHEDGEFVSLLSFEWHSMAFGDHCVYYKSPRGPLEPSGATSLEGLRHELRRLGSRGLQAFAIPHHIGYRSGRRGINWAAYTQEFSPVIEMISMHGCGEGDFAPRRYLHTMGPRETASTARRGLELGHRFGFIGSTDHHSAHPGSHGYGRAMVWADALTRDGIWEAIRARRTYAITGDRILLATSVNGARMGECVTTPGPRAIMVDALGGDAIDYAEIVRNGEVIAREAPRTSAEAAFDGVLSASVGWGDIGERVGWSVELEVRGGRIAAVEPRLHGNDVVAPQDSVSRSFCVSSWQQLDEHRVVLRTETRGNPNVNTDATQQIALHVIGDPHTVFLGRFNDVEIRHTVAELLLESHVAYLGGFLSAAVIMHRAVPKSARAVRLDFEDREQSKGADWYYARVRQKNDQYAWSSPTWVEHPSSRHSVVNDGRFDHRG
jgi:hypothetical protein